MDFTLSDEQQLIRQTARALWQTHRVWLILCGAIIAAFSFLPFANLLTPVLATAFMLHIFQDLPGVKEACERR